MASAGEHLDSNPALEDALDHVLPAWRRVPAVARKHPTRQRTASRRDSARSATCTGRSPRGPLRPGNGGLIRTLRQPCGTRSHWSGGFFDVCAGLLEVTAVEAPTVQLGLF